LGPYKIYAIFSLEENYSKLNAKSKINILFYFNWFTFLAQGKEKVSQISTDNYDIPIKLPIQKKYAKIMDI